MNNTKYNIGDVVYIVIDYKVIKSIINRVIITKDNTGEHVSYEVYEYSKKNSTRKMRMYSASVMVDDLKTAKDSALINWDKITKQVYFDIRNLTDKSFDPLPNENK